MSCRILVGDVRETLPTLADGSVRCVVTSPPYWRQRDYGMPGQIGLEATPEEYAARLVEVMREVRRVLADDGSLWLNIGEKWASGGNGGGGSFMRERAQAWAHAKNASGWRKEPPGYKDKDMVGLGWLVAFALRADGWWLRQANVWAKPNGMPESVTDRSSVSHEYVFHLTKSARSYYDNEGARTPPSPATETRLAQDIETQHGSERGNGGAKGKPMKAVGAGKQRGHSRRHAGFNDRWDAMERKEQVAAGARLRSVWWIPPAQYRQAHFAVMPEALARICILCGSAPGDTVLDPFGGSGTVGAVAIGHGRKAILCELNPAYADLAVQRVGPMYATTHVEGA